MPDALAALSLVLAEGHAGRPDVAAMLQGWLADRPSGGRLWDGDWASRRQGSTMIRVDLPSQMLRQASLTAADIDYEDAHGRVADFHALRHTFISNLARAGVHPRNAQALARLRQGYAGQARHSTIDLTMNVYTHVAIADLATDIRKLPAVPGAMATETKQTA